jgi:hypothetical protein
VLRRLAAIAVFVLVAAAAITLVLERRSAPAPAPTAPASGDPVTRQAASADDAHQRVSADEPSSSASQGGGARAGDASPIERAMVKAPALQTLASQPVPGETRGPLETVAPQALAPESRAPLVAVPAEPVPSIGTRRLEAVPDPGRHGVVSTR